MGEIDHHALVTDRKAADAMASTTHGHGQALCLGKLDGRDHVGSVSTAYDEGWLPVDHPIPDLTGVVIILIAWTDQCAMH